MNKGFAFLFVAHLTGMEISLYSKPQKWRVREWLATGLENRGPKGLGVRIPCPPPEYFVSENM